MICRNYRFVYKKGSKNVVDVELVADETPAALPTNPSGIEGFPAQWEPNSVQFCGGSILYVVDSGRVYIANESGEFIKQA